MSFNQINKQSDNIHLEQVSKQNATSIRSHQHLDPYMIPATVRETSFDVQAWTSRDWHLKTLTWNSSQTQGTNLASINVPCDIVTEESPLSKIFSSFIFTRFIVELYIRLPPIQFNQGSLIIQWIPGAFKHKTYNATEQTVTESYPYLQFHNAKAATMYHNVTVQAADINSPVIESTWSGFTAALNTLNYNFWTDNAFTGLKAYPQDAITSLEAETQQGTFDIMVLNRFATGASNPSSISVEVWCKVKDLYNSNPRHPLRASTAYGKAQGDNTITASPQTNVNVNLTTSPTTTNNTTNPGKQQQEKSKDSSPLGGITDLIGKGLDLFGSDIKGFFSGDKGGSKADANPLGLINGEFKNSDLFESLLQEGSELLPLALDKPRVTSTDTQGISSIASAPCFTKGPTVAHRLGVTPTGCHIPPKYFRGENKPIKDLWQIAEQPALHTTVSWNQTDPKNKILYETSISPLLCGKFPTSNPANEYVQPTFLSFISKIFSYWMGTIELTIELVATNYHNGILGITWEPGLEPTHIEQYDSTDPEKLSFDRSQVHNMRFNLGENASRSFKFSCSPSTNQDLFLVHGVELLSPTAQKPYTFIDHEFSNTNTDYDPHLKKTSGVFRLYVISPLLAAGSVAPFIDINIYINAGPDFHAAIPYCMDFRPGVYHPDAHPDSTQGNFTTLTLGQPVTPTASKLNIVRLIETQRQKKIAERQKSSYGVAQTDETETENDDAELTLPVPVPFLKPTFRNCETGTLFGDIVSTVKDLVCRKSQIFRGSLELTSADAPDILTFPVYPGSSSPYLSSPDNDELGGYKSFLEYFSRIFVYWSGSTDLQLLTSVSKNYALMARAHHNPVRYVDDPRPVWYTSYTTGEWQPYGTSGFSTDIFNIAAQSAFCLNIPHFDNKPLRFTQPSRNDRCSRICCNGTLVVEVNNSDPSLKSLQVALYHGAGDDFVFHHLIPPPPTPFSAYNQQLPDFYRGFF